MLHIFDNFSLPYISETRCVEKRKVCVKYYFSNVYLVKFHPLISEYMSRIERYELFELLGAAEMSNRVMWEAECVFWCLFWEIQGLES